MDRKYEFGGFEWKLAHEGDNVKNNIQVEDFFSWGTFDNPTKYTECSLANQALRKCVFVSQQFIECDFSMADASDSQFINCLFLNCKFKNTNFGKTSFIGSAFVETHHNPQNSNFDGAGMSQVRFLPSSEQRMMISNIKFHSLGFRHSVFNNVIIRNTIFDHCSFENALLNQCDIDLLKLDRSSCRGIVVKECIVQSFICTVEKVIGGIGILEMLQSCKKIKLEFANQKISDTEGLIKIFVENAATMNFAKNGKLFEFVNIMQYLYKQSKNFSKLYLEKNNDSLIVNSSEIIDGFRNTEFSDYLCTVTIEAYKGIIDRGESIDIDDILYTLKMMYFLDIREYKFIHLLETMLGEMNIPMEEDYTKSITLSQINYYFDKIGKEIKKEAFQITILNESITWKNPEHRLEFQNFIDEIFVSTGNLDYQLISLHEGSVEAVFDLINPEYFLAAVVILGVKFNYSEKKGVEFKFDPSAGLRNFGSYLNTVASTFPILGKKKVEEDVFQQILTAIPENLRSYVSKHKLSGNVEQKTAQKSIPNKKRKKIQLSTKDATIELGKKEKQ